MTRKTLISPREILYRVAGILGMAAVFVAFSWLVCWLVG
jgi:hypothetical protein